MGGPNMSFTAFLPRSFMPLLLPRLARQDVQDRIFTVGHSKGHESTPASPSRHVWWLGGKRGSVPYPETPWGVMGSEWEGETDGE